MNTHCIYRLSDFIGQVITEKCWTAWRTEKRKNKTTGEVKETKVPYQTITSESRSNDPTTWISIEAAEAVAATEGFINGGMGGVGLWLGIDYGTEYRVGGVDLDSCLSSDLAPWAKEIIDRFDTYGEISPSRTGIKLYFLYRLTDLDAIRLITGTDWSKNFKERTGSAHAPGFELHIGHRYFAMTGDLYEGCPEVLRVVEVEDIAWLIKEVGQRFTRSETAKSRRSETCTPSSPSLKRDYSRSGAVASRLLSLWVNGFVETYHQARQRLLNDPDPDIVAWMIEKGLERRGRQDEYEFRRLWEWVQRFSKSPATLTMQEAMQQIADEEDDPVDEAANAEPVEAKSEDDVEGCHSKMNRLPPTLSSRSPSLSAWAFLERQSAPIKFWRGDFYKWVETHYQKLDDTQMRADIRWFLDSAKTSDGTPFLTNAKDVSEVFDALKSYALLGSEIEPNSDPDLIGFDNGVLKVSTGELYKPHDPKRFSLHCLPFPYDPDLPPPTEWLRFLRSAWPDRDDYIDLLQEIFGYYISGRTDLQKIFLLLGPPRAGKGTIAFVLRTLLGERSVANLTMDKFGKDFGLQVLIGKTALIVPDARQGRTNLAVVTERLLNISGEDPIAISRKFKDDWDGLLKTRVAIMSNEVPRLPDPTGTIATRFVPVRLFISFLGREDTALKGKLLQEMAQIMNWALQGLARLNSRGFFLIPEDARETIEKIKHGATPVFEFREDHIIDDPKAMTMKQVVYDRFCGYLLSKGHERMSETRFSLDLQALIPELEECRPRVNGRSGPRMWKGIRLRSEDDPTLVSRWDDADVAWEEPERTEARDRLYAQMSSVFPEYQRLN